MSVDPGPTPATHWTGGTMFRLLVQFPVVCFTLALASDMAYWQTSDLMWTIASAWLLLVGIAFAVAAAIIYLLEAMMQRRSIASIDWSFPAGGLVILVLAFLNNLVHARDGWTSVVPFGLMLSILTVVVMIATAGLGTPTHGYRASHSRSTPS